jgi:hypothetical protein
MVFGLGGNIRMQADSGYQGLADIHANTLLRYAKYNLLFENTLLLVWFLVSFLCIRFISNSLYAPSESVSYYT